MKRRESFGLKGDLEFLLFSEDGALKHVTRVPNMIVYAGNDLIRDVIGQATGQPAGAQWIAIGTGTNAVSGADTSLQTENARTSGTYTESETAGGKKDKWSIQSTFGAGVGTGNITESGCFNTAISGGTMLCRQTFTAIPKGASDSLQATWTFTITNP